MRASGPLGTGGGLAEGRDGSRPHGDRCASDREVEFPEDPVEVVPHRALAAVSLGEPAPCGPEPDTALRVVPQLTDSPGQRLGRIRLAGQAIDVLLHIVADATGAGD